MNADIDSFLYHESLSELGRTARAFASAIRVAAERSKRMGTGDDLIALRVFDECRAELLGAFAGAPGMIQLFTGSDR